MFNCCLKTYDLSYNNGVFQVHRSTIHVLACITGALSYLATLLTLAILSASANPVVMHRCVLQ